MDPITPALQNWTIAPVANPEQSKAEQFLLVLSGIASVDLFAIKSAEWRNETFVIIPDAGPALKYAIETYSVKTFPPKPTLAGTPVFNVAQCAPFVAVGSVIDEETGAGNFGFAVNSWQLYRPTNAANPIFDGIEVNVALLNDRGATFVLSLSYNITLVGTIGHQQLVTK